MQTTSRFNLNAPELTDEADITKISENMTTIDAEMAGLSKANTFTDVNNFTAGLNGALTGNATTATKLQTARTINGVSFDGTQNINLPGVTLNDLTVVGALCFCSYMGTSGGYGTITSGAMLYPACIATDHTNAAAVHVQEIVLSGSWQCLGYAASAEYLEGEGRDATLWQRIA
jgi:hypothetical protein